jgi:hypothetical protein
MTDMSWSERTERVAFRGSREAVAPLSWAQRQIFPKVWTGTPGAGYFNVFFWLPIPAGRKMDVVLAAVQHAMSSYEALRTEYFVDSGGQPGQAVRAAGEIDVSIIATDAELTDADPDRMQYELGRADFDYTTSWPVRFTIVTSGTRPAYLIVVVSHLTIDGVGRARLQEMLTETLRDGPGPTPGASQEGTDQMIERASWEASAEGQRRSTRSLRGWGDLVRRLPTITYFPDQHLSAAEPVEPRRPLYELTSPAAARAAAILAERHAVGTPAVFLAASATMVAALCGHREIALSTPVANRSSSADRTLVGIVAQSSIVSVDTSGASFGEVVRAAQSSVLRSVGIARFDPVAWRALRRELALSGRAIEPDVMHNDARDLAAAPAGATGPEDPVALLAQSRMRLVGVIEHHALHFNMRYTGDINCVLWRLWTDRWHIPEPDATDCLLAVEALVVKAASGDDDESPVDWLRNSLRLHAGQEK